MFEIVILTIIPELRQDEFNSLLLLASPEKQERIRRFHFFRDAQNCLLGDVLARIEICRATKLSNNQLEFSVNAYGKPLLTNGSHIHFNISHAGHYVACAVADEPVGIDIEIINLADLKIAERFFTQDEMAYIMASELMYFDVTNFHFEIDKTDDFRKRGKEKNNRPDPIVQMALAMDADGIPLYYKLFPGNTHDSKTFIPVFKDVCVRFTPGRVIAVADMGCTSANNIYFLKGGDRDKRVNGYVFSFSIRKGSEKFKKYVLDDASYTDRDGKPLKEDFDYKVKSRTEVREIKITLKNGSQKSVLIDEKQVVFWSKKYADKARTEREETIKKALDIIANPKKHNKSTVHGAAAYIKNITFDKKTGEVLEEPGKKLIYDEEKAVEDAKYDGYYCIITSELEMHEQRVIEIYRGLSDIEDNFKVSKSDLDIQPVHVSRKDRINAHVLTCFISLVILRLIQKKTDYRFTPEQIITCLNEISCSHEHTNLYLFDYRSNISDCIGEAFGIDFTQKRLRLSEIKNILASSKK